MIQGMYPPTVRVYQARAGQTMTLGLIQKSPLPALKLATPPIGSESKARERRRYG